jgi:hypothetical protein
VVRFSDMLGGSKDPEDAAVTDSPYAALANDEGDDDDPAAAPDAETVAPPVKESVPMSTFESPEAVLSRLTRYATAARVAEPVATAEVVETEPIEEPEPELHTQPEVEPEPEEEPEPEPEPAPLSVGDDFLPNVRGMGRRRGRKRHP